MNINDVCTFLKQANTYYIATAEGDQPRVRPFGTAHLFEGRLYIQTGRKKSCYKQMKDKKVELCAMNGGKWLRLAGTLVEDERIEAERDLLAAYPSLAGMYAAGDGNNCVLYFKDATATISSFTEEPVEIRF